MRTRTDQPAPGGAPAHTPRWARLPASAAAGWAATLITTAIAALIRLTHLDNVPRLVFDETYYVKDAWSLIELGYEGTWPADYDASFAAGDTSGLSANASYPVHPPTGKWIIGWGMRLLGQSDPVGWRIMGAICGVITVFLLCRLAQNLFRSPAITALAGAFVATDGIAIVMSRTAILDGFLAMFSLAAFLAVVKDQQDARARLGARLAAWEGMGAPRRGWPDLRAYLSPRIPCPASWRVGPASGPRPWLLAAGVLAGLASSVKWSGVYVLAVLGICWLCGKEFDLLLMTALLTLAGYSLNDTVVIFDRIRENLRKNKEMPFFDLINVSINETLSRSVITVLTTLFMVVSLFLFGGATIHDFAFALLIGMLIGTYSSMFIASPLVAMLWKDRGPERA